MDNAISKSSRPKHNYLSIALRTILSFIGVSLIGLGAALMREGHVGLDPYTALNIGVSGHLGMELGTYQLISNLVIFVFILIFNIKQIGIGTILNMVLVGYEIQWFSNIYENIFGAQINFFVIIVDGAIGLLFFTLGTSIYMSTKLGVAPYDAIAPTISERFHIKYQYVRTVQDILFMVAAVIAGGAYGIMTIVTAFFAGPLITFWNKNVSEFIMEHVNHFSNEPSVNNVENGVLGASRQSYNWLHRAYRSTVYIQRHLSGYTDQELEEIINENNHQLRQNLIFMKHLEKLHHSLNEELKRRGLNQK
ncbi:membrane protein [Philodulcilactobacillus myokoensis]|uniref:Membrane protein n=1 Tax=Philodulcilactobacillus myokoensis TaxID=2929573 RepID=A0A9W6B0H4_9LACO|nr:membrane protein [Philodulcilactobacillus myokoensis]GLB46383.1 membrane protein [Philodulcilactobacillus myokoensis]